MQRWRRIAPQTWAIILLGLVATVTAAFWIASAERERREVIFGGLADSAVSAVETRMLAQLTLLRGTAGFFNASEAISRDEFRAYVERLRLEENYPGVLGIGYATWHPDRASAEAMVESTTAGTAPDFDAWPAGERPEYSAIIYLEPLNRMNREALGYDMLSQETRRAAMVRAREERRTILSGKVQLVQEIEAVKQPGFLVYLPLYEQPAGSGENAGPEGFYGWVYSPLRAYDFFGPVLGEFDDVAVEIFDGAAREANLLYRSARTAGDGEHLLVRTISPAQHEWTIRVTSTAGFDRRSPLVLGITVLLAGSLITMLLALLMHQQLRAAARTERQVAIRTAELRDSNLKLREEAAARAGAEAQVRHMQKLDAIGQLTGGIAHDFNNMLAVIVGNLDLAERRIDQSDRVRRAIANAKLGAEKAAELTRRLLSFGRRQALTPVVLDPNDLVRGMSELLRRTLGEAIELRTDLDDGVWPIFADRVHLESAILNLAINARDAMPDGGTLTIATGNCSRDASESESHDGAAPGDYVGISVTDTGTGMPAEIAAQAVEPFFTTKDIGKGSGLGLSQVYGFASQSGGQLTIDSEQGRGTSVTLYLPRRDGSGEALVSDSGASSEIAGGNPGEVILLVEDDDDVRKVSAESLRDLGYTVLHAANGAEALDLLERNGRVDLLFTDVVMPGMNGRALADEIRKRQSGVKVLFTTGYARDAVVHDGTLGDDVALINKPFSAADLARKVRALLDG